VRARIAAGLTQEGLAEKLGLKRQQIQRYEASEYATASLATVRQIAQVIESVVSTG
jgi:transcriptional regulator with XRE-family HTH domain